MKKFDYLVLGSGIAGLTYAAKMAMAKPGAKIAVVTKTELSETNTRYAQGGIAAVSDFINDDYKKHIDDTLIAGDFENDISIVEMVVRDAPERIDELVKWGASFDKENHSLSLSLEGGHSAKRIIHHKDITGFHLEKILINKCRQYKNIIFFEKYFIIDLITEHGACFGAEVIGINNHESEFFVASATVLATGGAGQMYSVTTNPEISTGDGVAMAFRVGAYIADMQYVQFHPTALYDPESNPPFLISEAVRGFGAILRNERDEDFILKYDRRGSLATRDIVSRAIYREMQECNLNYLWLDCRHLNISDFKNKFPNIFNKCLQSGIDLQKDMIPVVPAAHYICGGVKTDKNALTTIENLYAIGECACTGLHGANRLASNSLLEAVVFADKAFLHSKEIKPVDINFNNNTRFVSQSNDADAFISYNKKKIKRAMTLKAGIVKTNRGLNELYEELNLLQDECKKYFSENVYTLQLLEFYNLIQNCLLVVTASKKQKVNKGSFYNEDLAEVSIISSPVTH